MRKALVIFMTTCSVLLAGSANSQANGKQKSGPYTSTELAVQTSDSLRLCGTAFVPAGTPSYEIICLPMMGHTRESFYKLRDSLTAVGRRSDSLHFRLPAWKIFDLRGHGCSMRRGATPVDHRTMSTDEFAKYPSDIAGAITGKQGLTIIGASIGANTAALLTEQMHGIDRLVLLSPGLDYRGLDPSDALMNFAGKILLVASVQDKYSYESVREFASRNPDHCTLMIFEGNAHGTDIINDNPAAMHALVDWILKK